MSEKHVISALLKESILQLCKASVPSNEHIEVDGIVCITLGNDTQQIVVKVHEKIALEECTKGRKSIPDSGPEDSQIVTKRGSTLSQVKEMPEKAKDAQESNSKLSQIEEKKQKEVGKVAAECCVEENGGSQEVGVIEVEDYDADSPMQQSVNCEYCHMVVVSAEALVVHWQSTHNAYVCQECCKPFMKRPNYVRHMKMHENRSDSEKGQSGMSAMAGVWRCGICEEEHTSNLTLVQHMQTCHNFEQQLSCCLCQECFPNKTSFVVHRGLAHAGVTDIMCTACEVGFHEFELELHNKECDGIQYMTAASSSSMKRGGGEDLEESAAKRAHTDDSLDSLLPHVLSSQNLSLRRQKELFLAMYENPNQNNNSSDKVKPSSSPQGGSVVPFRWHQPVSDESPSPPSKKSSPVKKPQKSSHYTPPKTRILLSNGRHGHAKGPFRCGLCDELTFNIQDFTKHNMETHWRHVCPFCAQTFATRRNVKRHMRKHTGEQPYTCHICNKSFYRDDDLRRHKVLHDKPNFYSPRPNSDGSLYMDSFPTMGNDEDELLAADIAYQTEDRIGALTEKYMRELNSSPDTSGDGGARNHEPRNHDLAAVKIKVELD